MTSFKSSNLTIFLVPGVRRCLTCPNARDPLSLENLCHHFCPYREKYPFRKESPLLEYLKRHCPVWIDDPENCYNTDYIVANFVKIVNDKGLLQDGFLQCDQELKNIFKPPWSELSPRILRWLIENHLEIENRQKGPQSFMYAALFPDNPGMDQLISSLSRQADLFANNTYLVLCRIYDPLCPCKAAKKSAI